MLTINLNNTLSQYSHNVSVLSSEYYITSIECYDNKFYYVARNNDKYEFGIVYLDDSLIRIIDRDVSYSKIAYNPKDGKMYALKNGNNSMLYTIDISTGNETLVSENVDKDSKYNIIAFTITNNGRIVFVDSNEDGLYEYDINNGNVSLILKASFDILNKNQDISINRQTNQIYFVSSNENEKSILYYCDVEINHMYNVGTLNYQTTGFAIFWPEHVHSYSQDWSFDEKHHWHDCNHIDCLAKMNEIKDGYSDHIYDKTNIHTDDTFVNAGTCVSNAVYRYTCVCGAIGEDIYELENSIDYNNHVTDSYVYVQVEKGTHKKVYECCGADIDEIMECSGGKATCTDFGVCEKCSVAYLDPLGHDFVVAYDDEKHFHKCNRCGITENENEHYFGHTTIIKEATTSDEGLMERSCICGKTENVIIEKIPVDNKSLKIIYIVIAGVCVIGTITSTLIIKKRKAE